MGTDAVCKLGSEDGVVASLIMMIAGVLIVLLTPTLERLPIIWGSGCQDAIVFSRWAPSAGR